MSCLGLFLIMMGKMGHFLFLPLIKSIKNWFYALDDIFEVSFLGKMKVEFENEVF